MKKHLHFLSLTGILLLVLLSGCKKYNDTTGQGLAILFKNTVWSGEFKSTGRPLEPYSISFDDADGFLWHEQRGDYTGKYSINNQNNTILLRFSKGDLTAKISKQELLEFSGTLSDKPISCELNNQVAINLKNSEWRGLYNEVGGNPSLFFNQEDQGVIVDQGYSGLNPIPYTRKAGTFRYEYVKDFVNLYQYFSVIMPNGQIKGIRQQYNNNNLVSVISYKLTRQ